MEKEKEVVHQKVADFSYGDFVFTVTQPTEKQDDKEEQFYQALAKCLFKNR